MVYEISWFEEAAEELEEIYNFYLTKNPDSANDIYHSILDSINKYLTKNPNIGAVGPLL